MSGDTPTGGSGWLIRPPIRSLLDPPPPTVRLKAVFGARSQRGPLRLANEDHYLILRLGRQQDVLLTSLPDREVPRQFHEYGYGMVVADGMGGGGEAASRLAIATLAQLGIHFGQTHVRVDEPIAQEVADRVDRFYRSIEATLQQASLDGHRPLRSTLTAVFATGAELFIAHVGHSRAYLFRDGELHQLSRDHTIADPCATKIVDIAAGTGDWPRAVTETLGSGGTTTRIDIERCGLRDGDLLLLCTNGLTDALDDGLVAETLRLHPMPDEQCRALVALAARTGTRDNITALVGHVQISLGAAARPAK